jgi:hypothetical protein
VLIVLASRFDVGACSLVRRWAGFNARLLTCECLSRRGWTWQPEAPERASLVLDGEIVSIGSIKGAVSLLAGVGPSELPYVIESEREYVASEIMAFLLAWLSSLPCYVINRPTPLCLAGPRLHHEEWLREAARVGLAILPTTRRVVSFAERSPPEFGSPPNSEALVRPTAATVSVVAGRFVPTDNRPIEEAIASSVCRLASATHAGILTANFVDVGGELLFAGAAPFVDVSIDGIADAMLDAFGIVS